VKKLLMSIMLVALALGASISWAGEGPAPAKPQTPAKAARTLLGFEDIDLAEASTAAAFNRLGCHTSDETSPCKELHERHLLILDVKAAAKLTKRKLQVVYEGCNYIDPYDPRRRKGAQITTSRLTQLWVSGCGGADDPGAPATLCIGHARCTAKYHVDNGKFDANIPFEAEVGCKPTKEGKCPRADDCAGDTEVTLDLGAIGGPAVKGGNAGATPGAGKADH
jgi:hypothetical protein